MNILEIITAVNKLKGQRAVVAFLELLSNSIRKKDDCLNGVDRERKILKEA